MTTATPTAAPTTLVGVRTDERNRLKAAVDAAKPESTTLQADLGTAQTALTAATAALAAQDQDASRLRQQLAAATTGPERHRLELALDAVAVQHLRTLRARVDAADAVASKQAEIARHDARTGRLTAELTTAEAALTQATADAAEVTTIRQDLVASVNGVVAGVAALDPRVAEAQAKLGVLLGDPQMPVDLAGRLTGVANADAGRQDALVAAETAVRVADTTRAPVDGALEAAVAAHEAALAAARAAAAAPARLTAAAAAVDAVLGLPDLPAAEQAAITAAAQGTDDPAVIPVAPPATRGENWAIKIPAPVLDAAAAFLDAEVVLAELRALQGAALLTALDAAQTAVVTALLAQLAATRTQVDAAETAAAAADEVTAHAATTVDRRTLAVSGD